MLPPALRGQYDNGLTQGGDGGFLTTIPAELQLFSIEAKNRLFTGVCREMGQESMAKGL